MARFVEPRFRIAAAVDSVELEYRVAKHGVNSVAHDKRRGIIVSDLDTQSFVFGETVGEIASL